jgi:hypothetical protein
MAEERPRNRHPLSERCTARSKRTGLQCQQWVIGGGPCRAHGGNAPQVKAKREQRIVLAEARAEMELRQRDEPAGGRDDRSAEVVLLDLLKDAEATLQHLKANFAAEQASGAISPAIMILIGDWFDRVMRISKTVLDGNVEERLEQRRAALARSDADLITAIVFMAVTSADLSASQRVAVMDGLVDAVQQANAGAVPPMPAGALQRWVAKARADAAREARAAEEAGDLEQPPGGHRVTTLPVTRPDLDVI